jgi:hypothetical protein
MQVVIDVPDRVYKAIKNSTKPLLYVEHLIQEGTALPKGHGRLIDADAVLEEPIGNTYKDIDIAETIIEAESEDKK